MCNTVYIKKKTPKVSLKTAKMPRTVKGLKIVKNELLYGGFGLVVSLNIEKSVREIVR